jgi:hypothetical protein
VGAQAMMSLTNLLLIVANRVDVYRPATRFASIGQIISYLVGLVLFIILAYSLASTIPASIPKP